MNPLSGGTKEYVYYDVRVKRFRDSRGRFVARATALSYLLTHKTVPVRSRKGTFYWSSVPQATTYTTKHLASEVTKTKTMVSDTYSIDVTNLFELVGNKLMTDDSGVEAVYRLIKYFQNEYSRQYKNRRYYLYFSGTIRRELTEEYAGDAEISSRQLRENMETKDWTKMLVQQFLDKTNTDFKKFVKSDMYVEMEEIRLVFKGWEHKKK